MVNGEEVTLVPRESVISTVSVELPMLVGVPVKEPVVVEKVTPSGTAPDLIA
jgi:hypothetical protein